MLRTHSAIWSAASAASSPRLPTSPPARAHACSSVSAVITPKVVGTPVVSATCRIPAAASRATCSKWGVWPLMTTPTHTIPEYRPLVARWFAACGSSNDPGTQWTSIASGPSRAARSACRAPATSRWVMRSLKRAATIANLNGPVLPAARRYFGARPAISVRKGRKEVPELVALGTEVLPVRLGRRDLDRDALADVQPVALEADDLLRVVREELEILHAQVDQNLSADAVIAQIGVESEGRVGLDRVLALVLQLVGAHLVQQPDPAPFLPHVHEHAAALGLDPGQRLVELKPAVAAAGAEHVSRQTLGVYAHEHRRFTGDRAHHQRQRHAAVDRRVVGDRRELTVVGRQFRGRNPAHQLFLVNPVLDEVPDRNHLEPVRGRELGQLRHARHAAVVVEDLTDDAGRIAARQASQIDRGFGVTGAPQDAPSHRPERQDVPGAREVV